MLEALRITLLGRPRITLGDVALEDRVPAKGQALLYFLVVEGQARSRQTLAGLLWPDVPEASARRNLRVTLSTFPQDLKSFLVITRETLAFAPGRVYELDVQRLTELLRSHPLPRQEQVLDALQEAVALYKGEFLEEFQVRDAPDFEGWVVQQREQVRQDVLDALYYLSLALTARADYPAAIAYTTRLLALDSWREEGHRQMMRLLALTGQRSSALAQYDTCRRLLLEQVGVEPEQDTIALYEQIKAGEIGPAQEAVQDRAGIGQSASAPMDTEPMVSDKIPGRALSAPPAHWKPPRALDAATLVTAQRQLASLPLDTVPPPGPIPPGSRMPLRSNRFFVDREQELHTLAASLRDDRSIAFVTGLGGIGKTQLAVEFVHRYAFYFAGGVFWLNFANPDAIVGEIALCGGPGYLALHPDFSTLPAEDQLQLVFDAWRSPLPRLLVFDNCEEESLLTRWLPNSGGCRALVTSRRASWEPLLGGHTIALSVLRRPDSITLLRRYCPPQADDDPELDDIAAELGDLTLALHLAGAFLVRYHHSFTPATYLHALCRSEQLDHPSLQGRGLTYSPTDHSLDVARTFALSYERLDPARYTDALARALLQRAAYFAPDVPIPRELLVATLGPAPPDPVALLQTEDALRRLTQLGLLTRTEDGACHLHSLLASFVYTVAPDVAAQTAVEQAMLDTASYFNTAGYPAPLLALQSHLRFVTDNALCRNDGLAARLCNALGRHLQTVGHYEVARHYFSSGLVIREAILGSAHPETAASLNDLGRLLLDQRELVKAQVYLEEALAIRKDLLGPDHPDTAETLINLGMLLKEQRDFTGARHFLERALAIRRIALGHEHPLTADSLSYLGILLVNQQDYVAASLCWEEAKRIWEATLGPHHPNVARALNNLGVVLKRQGDFAAARAYYEQAWHLMEAALGAYHPYTAATLLNLGQLLKLQGDSTESKTFLKRALLIFEQVLGPHHPNTAEALNLLADLQTEQRG
ncbi:MAG: tetratricopeptide repeat protein [Ardenticatenaceae bacterium]